MPIGIRKYFLVLSLILTAVVSAVVWYFTRLGFLYVYLISINIITFLIYGYDKQQARNSGMRIPEFVLHVMALAGGTIGALSGRLVFRHKTRKRSFIIFFWAIAILQAVAIYLLRDYIGKLL